MKGALLGYSNKYPNDGSTAKCHVMLSLDIHCMYMCIVARWALSLLACLQCLALLCRVAKLRDSVVFITNCTVEKYGGNDRAWESVCYQSFM